MGRWTIAPAPGVLCFSGASYAGASPEVVEAIIRRLADLSLVDPERLQEPYRDDEAAAAALHQEFVADLEAALGEADEIVEALLCANANKDQASHGFLPMEAACSRGHLGVVQLLSSYGASRTWPSTRRDLRSLDTAEHLAADGNVEPPFRVPAGRAEGRPSHRLNFSAVPAS